MATPSGFISKVGSNLLVRNIILAVCAIIVFVFIVAILLSLLTRHNRYQDVPDFSGMTIEEAGKAGEKGELVVELNDSLYVPTAPGGAIIDQFPKAGSQVKAGRKIFVTVNAYGRKKVKIPYVTGFSLRQAKNNLQLAGLEIDRIIYRDDIATSYVLEQQYGGVVITENGNKMAEQGTGVILIVGLNSGEVLPAMPKFIGLTLSEAKNRIWDAGMNVGKVHYDENVPLIDRNGARVYRQSTAYGRRSDYGTVVDLYLTLEDEKVRSGAISAENSAKRQVETVEASEPEVTAGPDADDSDVL